MYLYFHLGSASVPCIMTWQLTKSKFTRDCVSETESSTVYTFCHYTNFIFIFTETWREEKWRHTFQNSVIDRNNQNSGYSTSNSDFIYSIPLVYDSPVAPHYTPPAPSHYQISNILTKCNTNLCFINSYNAPPYTSARAQLASSPNRPTYHRQPDISYSPHYVPDSHRGSHGGTVA